MSDPIQSRASSYNPICRDDAHEDRERQMSKGPTVASKAPASYDVDPNTQICAGYKPAMPAAAKKSAPPPTSEHSGPSSKHEGVKVEPGHSELGVDKDALAGVRYRSHGPEVKTPYGHGTTSSTNVEVGLPYVRASRTEGEVVVDAPALNGAKIEVKGPSTTVTLGPKITKDGVSVGVGATTSKGALEVTHEPAELQAAKKGMLGAAVQAAAKHVDIQTTAGVEYGGVGKSVDASVRKNPDGSVEITGKVVGLPLAHHLEALVGGKVVIRP